MIDASDRIGWKTHWRIDKFKSNQALETLLRAGAKIALAKSIFPEAFIGTVEWDGNVALNEGINNVIELVCGISTPTKWDNLSAYLGVGDSSASTSPSQTGLQAASNKTWKAMDATYPQRSNQTAEWRSTYGSSDANYAWEEYTVVNASDDTGQNLNRRIASKGTKASGETWVLSLKITFA